MKKLNIFYNGDIVQLAYSMRKTSHYDIKPSIINHEIKSLSFKYIAKNEVGLKVFKCNVYVRIVLPEILANLEGEMPYHVESIDEFSTARKLATTLSNSVFQYAYKSEYSESLNKALKFMTKPMSFKIGSAKGPMVEIDKNKWYTHQLEILDKVPVFNRFDYMKKYEGEPIDDMTLYVIENESHILETTKQSLCYGYNLYRSSFKKILYYIRPSNVHKTNFKSIVQEIYDNKILHQDKKKHIVNVIVGLLEKSKNRSSTCCLFTDAESAIFYVKQNGGELREIKEEQLNNDIDYGLDYVPVEDCEAVEEARQVHNANVRAEQDKAFKLYYVYNENVSDLKDGFLPIKEMIYQNSKYTIKAEYDLLSAHNINCYSIKTDALLIKAGDADKVLKLLNFSDNRGCWKMNKVDVKASFFDRVQKDEEMEEPEPLKDLEEIKIDNEWSQEEILSKIKPLTLVLGKTAGAGKSHLCKSVNSNMLMVCPTQQLKEEQEGDALTCHKFFGIQVGEDTKINKSMAYDNYDAVCFEEIYKNDVRIMAKIQDFIKQNGHYVLANGDLYQKLCIEQPNHVEDMGQYFSDILKQIFKYCIVLVENKRMVEEERHLAHELLMDIVNGKKRKDIIDKYFGWTSKIETAYNLTYTNAKSKYVSGMYRKNKIEGPEYQKDEQLIFKGHNKKKSTSILEHNCTYTIVSNNGNTITVKNKGGDIEEVNTSYIKSSFIYAYARTVDSVQGVTVKNTPMTIFEYNHPYMDDNTFYVACTRTNSFKLVKFFDSNVEGKSYYGYCKSKIAEYKKQDAKAGRELG